MRPLAAAADTSDRMLLYYFTDKAALIASVLEHATQRLAVALARATPKTQQPYDELRATIWKILGRKTLRPYMHLWLDISARAARDEPPYKDVGGHIARGFLDWIGGLLTVEHEQLRAVQAAQMLLQIEGMLVLDAVGLNDLIQVTLQSRSQPRATGKRTSRVRKPRKA